MGRHGTKYGLNVHGMLSFPRIGRPFAERKATMLFYDKSP